MPVIDDFSRLVTVYFMARKSNAADLLLKCINEYETQTGNRVKTVQADNGGEFTSIYLKNHLQDKGIRLQTTFPYTPEQNGIAERMNRTLTDRARTILTHASLPKKFWQHAMATAAHVTNRIPSNATSRKTPFELWSGTRPDVRHFRSFGCRAYAHIPDQKRSKLDPKADVCTFIGYAMNQKGYILLRDRDGTTLTARNVYQVGIFSVRYALD
jgi:transposase InsO family protein